MTQTDPDYDLRGCRRRAAKKPCRELIDTVRARRLYDKLGSWRAVAEFVRRKDGTAFQPQSIMLAVRWEDQGNAGRIFFAKDFSQADLAIGGSPALDTPRPRALGLQQGLATPNTAGTAAATSRGESWDVGNVAKPDGHPGRAACVSYRLSPSQRSPSVSRPHPGGGQ